jgi:hypothetical protein
MNPNASSHQEHRTLAVRAMLSHGKEPFQKIVQDGRRAPARRRSCVDHAFLPSPMIERLQSEGFQARPERRGDGGWQTYFSRQ